MCVAFPMKITERVDSEHCRVECSGVGRQINIRLLPDCNVGDYVLVHAGYAIEKVAPEQAESDLELFRELEKELEK